MNTDLLVFTDMNLFTVIIVFLVFFPNTNRQSGIYTLGKGKHGLIFLGVPLFYSSRIIFFASFNTVSRWDQICCFQKRNPISRKSCCLLSTGGTKDLKRWNSEISIAGKGSWPKTFHGLRNPSQIFLVFSKWVRPPQSGRSKEEYTRAGHILPGFLTGSFAVGSRSTCRRVRKTTYTYK